MTGSLRMGTSYCPRHPMEGRVTVACVYGRQSRRRLSFTMMVHGGYWGAPRVMAALAGLVHDRQSPADYERSRFAQCFVTLA